MRKVLAYLLVALMLSSPAAVLATELTDQAREGMVTIYGFEQVENTIGIQEGTVLTVGSTTEMGGLFATDMWGNNTADIDARTLLHGYSTIEFTRTMGLAINGTAVGGVQTAVADNGDRTYTFQIAQNLVYNDGTQITAKDYVFSLLLSGSPELKEIGGMAEGMHQLLGYDAYYAGETKALSGVRLLSDYSFSMTISADYLPYFYGLAMLNVTPYPMSVIAPGCDIIDTEEGVTFTQAADAQTMDAQALGFTPGEFSAEMLSVTMLDPETGYVYNPRVTSGPYSLESFDKETRAATFRINPLYLGNYEGQMPHIEQIVFKHVTNETMMDAYAAGEVDLLNKVSSASAISEGMALAREDGTVRYDNYPRTGLTFLAFACEQGPASYLSVRQAIARCIDKQELVNVAVGATNGIPVHGYYGLGQWMIGQNFPEDAENGYDELNAQAELEKLRINLDLQEAEQLLIDGGWTLNPDGEPYVKGVDDIRYRELDEGEDLMPLIIKWAKTTDIAVADTVEALLAESFAEIGIGLEITEMPFSELLTYYYRQNERTYDMFYLADNFNYTFDPFPNFNTADEFQGLSNTTGLLDDTLMELAWLMRVTGTTDTRTYVERWIAFQNRWVEMMPMVPLYSSVYFDFYKEDLQDYYITDHAGWALAVPYAWFGEAPEPQDFLGGFTPEDEYVYLFDDQASEEESPLESESGAPSVP